MSSAKRPQPTVTLEELTRVYLSEYRLLVRTAAFLLRSPADAEDVVQHVYVHLISGHNNIRDLDKVAAYLRRSVVHRSNSVLRHLRVAQRHASRTETPATVADPYDAFERNTMVAALRNLPRREREAVVLRYYADLSVQGTADAMQVSAGAVKAYTSRALTRLAELLRESS